MNGGWKGNLIGILSAVCYGMNPLFGLHLYGEGMTPLSVLFYRFFFACLMLAGWMLASKKSFAVSRRDILPLAGIGLLLGNSCLCWFFSFRVMDSGIAAALLYLTPVFVAVIMTVWFHEKMTLRLAAGIILAVAGGVTLCCRGTVSHVTALGVILALSSAFSYAFYIIAVKESRLKRLAPETLTFYAMFFGLFLFLIPLRGGLELEQIPTLSALGNGLGLAFFPSFLSFLLMAVAVHRIGPTQTAILGAFEPLTAVVIGVLVFSEPFTQNLLWGFILILTSVPVVILNRN